MSLQLVSELVPRSLDLTIEWAMIMTFLIDVKIEGRSIIRPPLFEGNNFSYWKNAMQIFIESTDMELWEIVNNGPYVASKITNDKGEEVHKPNQ